MNVLGNLKIGVRLAVAFGGMLLLTAIVAVIGFVGVSDVHAGLKTIYEDRTVVVWWLADIDREMVQSRLLLSDSIDANSHADIERMMRALEEGHKRSDKIWADYLQTYLTPDEEKLAKAFDPQRQALWREAIQPVAAKLLAGNIAEAKKHYDQTVDKFYIPANATIGSSRSCRSTWRPRNTARPTTPSRW